MTDQHPQLYSNKPTPLGSGAWTRKLCAGILLAVVLLAVGLHAQAQKHGADETRQDIQRHRAMAAAHEAAAKCLETGKPAEQCQKTLQESCKGLAIGRYCGMKHAH